MLRLQKGKCSLCDSKFLATDIIEIDHIQPLSQGGQDRQTNCQVVHKTCHIQKSRIERVSNSFKMEIINREPDEVKASRPDLKTGYTRNGIF